MTFDILVFLQTMMHCSAYLVAVPLCTALLLWSLPAGGTAVDATAAAAAAEDGVIDAAGLGIRRHLREVSDLKRGHPDMNRLVFGRRGRSMTRKRNNQEDDDENYDDIDGICRSVVALCGKLHSNDI